jgi:hypothetical protein
MLPQLGNPIPDVEDSADAATTGATTGIVGGRCGKRARAASRRRGRDQPEEREDRMPYKAIVLLKRADGVTVEEFRAWFLGPHAGHAIDIAGERALKYTASFIVGPGPRTTFDGGEPPYDVVSELWCRDRETLEALYADLAADGGEVNEVVANSSVRISMIGEEHDLLAI